MAGGRTRVLIADDHTMFRQGLASILRSLDDMQVIGLAPNDESAIALAREKRPDVVVMEARTPLEVARRALFGLLEISPPPKVIVATTLYDPRYAQELTRLGAGAYILKSAPVDRLVKAIRSAVLDGAAEDQAPQEPSGPPGGPLSARELEVLLLVARGASDRGVASRLYLSEATVKRHLANAYAKMGVGSRAEAARMALAEGWISVRDVTQKDGGS